MIVSIILPIRNEEQFIGKTLQSIIDQKFKGELEIIISDGMSNDDTRVIVKEFQNNHKNIILIDNYDQIVPNGFNRALSISKGDIIIRLDGHAFLNPDFICNCLSVQEHSGADCVGGPTSHISDSTIGHHISIAQSSKFGAGGASFRTGVEKGKYVNTLAFGAYKRTVFFDNGAYDEELIRNQDEEFNFRLIQHGKKIWIDPTIKSTYFVRDSLVKLFKQYYQYGFFKVRVIQKASIEALLGDQSCVEEMKASFLQRRDLIVRLLNELPGVKCAIPNGAFYVFPDFSSYLNRKGNGKLLKDTFDISEYILDSVQVVTVPGDGFGSSEHIRFSYATNRKIIQEGMDRVKKALAMIEE